MAESKLRDDPILEKHLTEAACPYPQGSAGSVVFLQGYRAGLLKALDLLCAELGRAVPNMTGSERVQ